MSTAVPVHPGAGGNDGWGVHWVQHCGDTWELGMETDPTVVLWGALARGCQAQGGTPSHPGLCHAVGRQPHGAMGPRSRLPFPLTGAVKEALCAWPLPWPVRTSGSPA